MFLGEIIKEYRSEHGKLTMAEFAKISGLSKGYISMLEKNQDPRTREPIIPSLDTIKKVADAIGESFNSVFSKLNPDVIVSLNSSTGKEVSLDEFELIEDYKKLSFDDKIAVKNYIKTKAEIESLSRKVE